MGFSHLNGRQEIVGIFGSVISMMITAVCCQSWVEVFEISISVMFRLCVIASLGKITGDGD